MIRTLAGAYICACIGGAIAGATLVAGAIEVVSYVQRRARA